MTSAWRRRLVVTALDVVALGLVTTYLLAVRPMANEWELHVRNGIQSLGNVSNVQAQKEALDGAFKSYRQQTDLGTVLLVAAFALGMAAVIVGGVLNFVESKQAPGTGTGTGTGTTGLPPAAARPA